MIDKKILDLVKFQSEIDKMSEVTFDDKKPKGAKHHVGVEIEFYSYVEENVLKYAFKELGIEKYVGIKYDGSLTPHYYSKGGNEYGEGIVPYSYEITVCAPENKIKSVIKNICEILTNVDSFIDSQCGLHVHLDMRNRDQKKCYKKLVNNMSAMFEIFPRRKYVEYCQPNESDSWERTTPRYSAINKQSYSCHKTLEVRVAEGSIKGNEINGWIDFLLTVINSKKVPKNKIHSIKEFKKFYKPKRKDIYNIIA